MKINQVEQIVGITKKNIRFYESQGLLHPTRNQENGYRDYTEDDIRLLQQIKLLRKLAVPIEEIRKLQTHRLSLAECLRRHTIHLDHEAKNIALTREMCEEMILSEESLHTLDALVYLEKMKLLEEGGTRFMDIQRNDRKRKKIEVTTAAIVMIALMAALIAMFYWTYTVEPIPFPLLLFVIAVPTVIIIGVFFALCQRLKEIEGGEEYEASNY